MPAWACAVVFALYIQNTKLEGVICQNPEQYICITQYQLRGNPQFWGLDRFWGFSPWEQFACFQKAVNREGR